MPVAVDEDPPHGRGVLLARQEASTISRNGRSGINVSPEEEAELLEAIAEADRGATISAEEIFARLGRIR